MSCDPRPERVTPNAQSLGACLHARQELVLGVLFDLKASGFHLTAKVVGHAELVEVHDDVADLLDATGGDHPIHADSTNQLDNFQLLLAGANQLTNHPHGRHLCAHALQAHYVAVPNQAGGLFEADHFIFFFCSHSTPRLRPLRRKSIATSTAISCSARSAGISPKHLAAITQDRHPLLPMLLLAADVLLLQAGVPSDQQGRGESHRRLKHFHQVHTSLAPRPPAQ